MQATCGAGIHPSFQTRTRRGGRRVHETTTIVAGSAHAGLIAGDQQALERSEAQRTPVSLRAITSRWISLVPS
jgi:hypothetical protein